MAANYDVFLSHRGPDTKRSFAILLKKELEEQRITTFFDDRSLQAGDNAPELIKQAMRTAEWGLIVLSPGFFASGCCMEELKAFLDRGRAILIGFGLTANECSADLMVARAKGTIWEQHGGRLWESCSRGGQVWIEEEWRNVVGRAKNITILELQKVDGYWDKCMAEAVQITGQKLGRPVVSKKGGVDMTPFQRNMNFLGRDNELAGITEGLAKPYGRVCITGMGGMGKTQLALEYVYMHEREYSQILWVDADGGNLNSSYIGLASHLGVRLEAPPGDSGVSVQDEADAVSKVREALENVAVPCLLVLDSLNNEKDLAEVVPKKGPCHVIVTSRLGALSNCHRVKVGVLKEEDGLQLLRGQEIFSVQEEQHLQELADKFGYLTLALAISSRLFAGGRLHPSDLLEQFKDCGPLVFKPEDADPVFSKCPVLAILFQTTFDLLAMDACAGEVEKELALHLAWVGGWFASSPIRLELVAEASVCSLKASGHVEARKAQKLGTRAVGLLEFYALATSTSNGRVAFHPLVQSFGRWKGGEGAGVAMIQGLLEVGSVEQDLDHFKSALEQATPVGEGAIASIPLAMQDGLQLVEKIGTPLGGYYREKVFQPSSADRIMQRCAFLLITVGVLEGAPSWAFIFDERAYILQATGKYDEAKLLFQRALEIREAKLGSHHPDTATSLDNLALLFQHQGKYSDAEPLHKRALEIREAELGPRHPDTAMSLNNLALLFETQGKYGDVEPLYKRALEICEAKLGPRHLDTATSISNLASLFETQGKYGAAEPLYNRALEIRETKLGPRHPDTAASLDNLALLFHHQGKYSDAEPLSKRALEIRETELGPRHPDTATSLDNLALLFHHQGKYSDAEPLYKRALEIREAELGPRHPDTASSLNNLAGLFESQGKYGAAEPLYKRALDIFEAELGPRHPDTAISLDNLAGLFETQGNYGAAEPLYKRALEICEAELGACHKDTAISFSNLAGLLLEQGKYDEAEPLYRRAIKVFEEVLGSNHPNTATCRGDLALLLERQAEAREAEISLGCTNLMEQWAAHTASGGSFGFESTEVFGGAMPPLWRGPFKIGVAVAIACATLFRPAVP